MGVIQLLLAIILLNLIYYLGKLIFAKTWGIHHKHYFLGVGPEILFFSVKGIKFSIGIVIPLPWLFRIYNFETAKKSQRKYNWQFFEFPLWKRITIAFSGAVSLILFGGLSFIFIAYFETKSYISKDEVNKHGIYPSDLAFDAGFLPGDRILMIDNKAFDSYDDINNIIFNKVYQVLRKDSVFDIHIDDSLIERARYGYYEPFFKIAAPFEVYNVLTGSIADEIGLRKGDKILSINGVKISCLPHYLEEFSKISNDSLELEFVRELDSVQIFKASIVFNDPFHKKLGFASNELISFSHKRNNFFQAIREGTLRSFNFFVLNLKGIKSLFFAEKELNTKAVSGPIGISELFGNNAIGLRFWTITAYLSFASAFLTFLPFPRTTFFDILPLAVEGISGKRISYERFLSFRKMSYILSLIIILYLIFSDLMKIIN